MRMFDLLYELQGRFPSPHALAFSSSSRLTQTFPLSSPLLQPPRSKVSINSRVMEIQTSGKPIESLLEKVHCMNIISSDYFKELYRLSTYHEVIDEIYNQVDNVEPWMNGNCRGPSTAFCLLYKFFTMKLTVKQMDGLLKHPDSPYIRAIGFLYLRYLADPKSLWTWFESYVTDEEEFSPGTNGQVTTMGVYVRDLLLGQFYFDTLFPRIPVLIMRQIVANLERMKLPTKQSGITGESVRHGSDDIARRPPSVKAALSVSFGQRAPHRASTRPVQRTLPLPHGRNGSDDVRRSPRNRCSQTQEFSDRDQERGRDRDRDREDRDREREWDRNRVRQKERDRDRDRIRERDRDKRHEFEYDRHDNHESRNYYKSKYVDQERERGRRDCEKSSHDSRHRESSSRRSRSRSRSLQVHNHHSSPLRDGSKEKASASCNLAKLRDLYGDTGDQKGYSGPERVPKDSSGEEVIRLGGSTWK